MNEHDMTEQAYKNGYEAGKRDAVKQGRWINEGDGDWRCSVCRSLYSFDDYGDEHPTDDYGCNYCPNCGADMRGDCDGCKENDYG